MDCLEVVKHINVKGSIRDDILNNVGNIAVESFVLGLRSFCDAIIVKRLSHVKSGVCLNLREISSLHFTPNAMK